MLLAVNGEWWVLDERVEATAWHAQADRKTDRQAGRQTDQPSTVMQGCGSRFSFSFTSISNIYMRHVLELDSQPPCAP
jgi:hypothetical protein